jgi:putative nucleotidyltransferase with HDIG domain
MRLKSVESAAEKDTQVFRKGRRRTLRILLVDDDPALRTLLKTTFEVADVAVVEAEDAATARRKIRSARPDVIVLDINMPGTTGLELCAELKAAPATRDIPIVLLTGSEGGTSAAAKKAGADAFVLNPFSPLELLAVAERLAGGLFGVPFRAKKKHATRGPDEELLLYARDLRHMLEVERGQRELLQSAYLQTVSALASALESKDTGTRQHSHRVQRYALELARAVSPDLADDPSVEYGFLLHDVGKIGIPDRILQKAGPLNEGEARLMKTHTVLGEQMLGGVSYLQQEGIRVVRSHHERWDGRGYPDGLAGTEIPLAARIFAVADAFDAMTSDRPYRPAQEWDGAGREIVSEAKRQFDPNVVDAFRERQGRLREIHREFAAA